MSSVNPHDDYINTYNMIKQTLLKILMQLRYLNKVYEIKDKHQGYQSQFL